MATRWNLQQGGEVQRRRVAIVFADLAESVRLMQHDEAGAIARWRRFAAEVRDRLVPAVGARMVRTAGDGLLIECPGTPGAVALALALHARIELANQGHPAAAAMLLRVGIHVADVVIDEHDLYGSGVNLAARVATLAQPGEVVVSAAARDELVDGVHADLEDLGLRFLKHLEEPVRAFRARPPGAGVPATTKLPPPSYDDLRPAVAVVPFAAMPDDAERDALGHAMADDIIAALSRHAGLRVLSRLSTAALGSSAPEPAAAHRLLGASFLLSGRYYRHGSRVRLNVELCALPGAEVLWSDSATTEIDALFAGQDELVPRIVGQVGQQVLARELARVRGLPMTTLASYTLYLGATGLMNSLVPTDFARARDVLDHLADRHPRQAAPHAMLARWHVFRSVQGWAEEPRREAMAAQAQAERAIDVDPGNAVALGVKGLTLMNYHDDLNGARGCYQAALESDPADPYAWALLSGVLSHCGEDEQACTAALQALALSPLDPNLFLFEAYAAMAFVGARRFDLAARHALASLRRHALHVPSHRQLIAALWLGGQHESARDAAVRLLQIQPRARVGERWRTVRRPAETVWGEVFAQALKDAGVPA